MFLWKKGNNCQLFCSSRFSCGIFIRVSALNLLQRNSAQFSPTYLALSNSRIRSLSLNTMIWTPALLRQKSYRLTGVKSSFQTILLPWTRGRQEISQMRLKRKKKSLPHDHYRSLASNRPSFGWVNWVIDMWLTCIGMLNLFILLGMFLPLQWNYRSTL